MSTQADARGHRAVDLHLGQGARSRRQTFRQQVLMKWRGRTPGVEQALRQRQAIVTVGNLEMTVTEDIMCNTFEHIGVVDGVRILEECGPDGSPSGIVGFQDPEDAEGAHVQQRFDGVELCGGRWW